MFVKQNKCLAFTLIELLIVVAMISVLIALISTMSPQSASQEVKTASRIHLLKSALESYHRSFYLYPASTDNYYDSTDSGYEGPKNIVELLTARNIRRNDGKHLAAMFALDDEDDQTELGDDGQRYFVDAWHQRFTYYSGTEIFTRASSQVSTTSTADIPVGATSIVVSDLTGFYVDNSMHVTHDGVDGEFHLITSINQATRTITFSGATAWPYDTDSIVSTWSSRNAHEIIGRWCQASGAVQEDNTRTVSDYENISRVRRHVNLFFLISAGEDGKFSYNYLPSGISDSYDPAEYQYVLTYGPDDKPKDVRPDIEDRDDLSNYNLAHR